VVEVERMAGIKTLVDYARTKALNLGPLLGATHLLGEELDVLDGALLGMRFKVISSRSFARSPGFHVPL
jgi:hypothetical protein